MPSKTLLSLCLQALLLQFISAQCIPNRWNGRLAPQALAAGLSPIAMAESIGFPRGYSPYFGSGLALSSGSPIAAKGILVTSENVYDGALTVAGRLPFLSAVQVEGIVLSAGAGGVLYGCNSGGVSILAEDIAPVGAGYGLPGPCRAYY